MNATPPIRNREIDDTTIKYYDLNAADFFNSTVGVDMSPIHDRFIAKLPKAATILDAGCGSGRDARVFAEMGFTVTAFDASPELAKLATEHCGFDVSVRLFSNVHEVNAYDGIWCCASLLHVSRRDLPTELHRLWKSLRPNGTFYVSFKLGESERVDNGRNFTDINEAELDRLFLGLPDIANTEIWTTADQRPGRSERWVNALVTRAAASQSKLVTGGADPFLPHLSHALANANVIEIAVAFVKVTGLRLLMPDLLAALDRNAEEGSKNCSVRILTSDYLEVTDPEALRLVLLLQERGAEARIFSTVTGGSFHLKAYIFSSINADSLHFGTAFVGSSNITGQALLEGLEWNYRIGFPGDEGFFEVRQHFEELFNNQKSIVLTSAWVDEYERRRVQPLLPIAPGSNECEPIPEPNHIQAEALAALAKTRELGYQRGLVVLATGLGKTWLAAFDSVAMKAKRVLFVAHREEILTQAAETFLRIRPQSRVGFYMGKSRDAAADVLCASVQTLARSHHIERFLPQHFDYVVIDEFHHAAASTYRRLLSHFAPSFLLGLTATPERSDQSDILSLCDDNLIFTRDLFAGIEAKLLSPFHYYGILDESVDYTEIPWRNGRFDPEQLSIKLATIARAEHALKEWKAQAQQRTLAFCVSVRHANFMAEQFNQAGVRSAAVYAGSNLGRAEALENLRSGKLQLIFSVDLFNEGVDLPEIDTVMMLRPTESKILFLQQLGRGLRRANNKEKLVVLDFIGNHQSFLHKPQALFQAGTTYKALAQFAHNAELGQLNLPEGCYVNFHLGLIEFLKSLDSTGPAKEYAALRASLGHRPALAEFYRSGANLQTTRNQYGSWFRLVAEMADLTTLESSLVSKHALFFREIEITAMEKCFKMILLEAFLELDGLHAAPTIEDVCERSWQVLQRRQSFLSDLPEARFNLEDGKSRGWLAYWQKNPIHAWIGGNRASIANTYFEIKDGRFALANIDPIDDKAIFADLIYELVDYRFAAYEVRRSQISKSKTVPAASGDDHRESVLPYFFNLESAFDYLCAGSSVAAERRALPSGYGKLDPARHFIARASSALMDGDTYLIRDGDYLLMEGTNFGDFDSFAGKVIAVERVPMESTKSRIMLGLMKTNATSQNVLHTSNPVAAVELIASHMRVRAKLIAVVDHFDMAIGQSFMREEIPALFDEEFNPGNWHSGHIAFNNKNAHILLVTLNKQGKSSEHRFHDYWVDKHTFHWQSQNSTMPTSKKGLEIIEHAKRGITIHLFVRESKLSAGKAAPFTYYGKATYLSHSGSSPMSVMFHI